METNIDLDKAPIEISDSLQRCIEGIVEDVILNGYSYEEQKKYLNRYCQEEGINFPKLDSALMGFFNMVSIFKETGSASSEHLIHMLGKDCYLSEDAVKALLSQGSPKTGSNKKGKKRGIILGCLALLVMLFSLVATILGFE